MPLLLPRRGESGEMEANIKQDSLDINILSKIHRPSHLA